jgi:hypothetical protein
MGWGDGGFLPVFWESARGRGSRLKPGLYGAGAAAEEEEGWG